MSEQLFITEFDEVLLPHEYHFSHNFSVRLYDDLVSIILDKDIQKRMSVTVNFKDGEKRPDENEEDIIGWLIKNGRKEDADEITTKHLVLAVISDICHFIHQALYSAKNIRMTVAFSLMRKPFLENLLIIEQLFTNESEFLKRFDSRPEDYDPGKLKNEEKLKLIEACLSKIKTQYFEAEMIYKLRFDKNSSDSFYAISNLATHLVTTRYSDFKTEKNNMNFIFSEYEDWDSQLHYFYYFFPYILFYVAEIVDEYLIEKRIIKLKKYQKRKFFRFVGQILQFDQFNDKAIKGTSPANKIAKALKFNCKNCNKINQIFKSDMFSLVNSGYILCKHCLVDLYAESNSLDELTKKMFHYSRSKNAS